MPTTRLRAALTASTLAAATVLALVDATAATAAPAAAPPPGGSIVPIAPVRVLDSRSSSPGGLTQGQFDPTSAFPRVQPGTVTAVLLNVTVVNASSAGYIRVGEAAQGTSNGNFVAGRPSATLALVPLSHSTAFANYVPFTASTRVSVVVDVQGYVTTASGTTSTFTPTGPTRAADSRISAGLTTFAPNGTQLVDIRKRASLPANATAIVANVTVVKPSAATYVTAFPSGTGRPTASTVNAAAGSVVANRVVVPLGSDGRIALYNFAGRADVVVDVVGYLAPDAAGSYYVPATLARRLTDHTGTRQTLTPDRQGTSDLVTTAVWVGLAATSDAAGYLAVGPTVTLPARTSDLNLVAGRAVANSGPVALTASGSFSVVSAPSSRFVVDLAGFFQKNPA